MGAEVFTETPTERIAYYILLCKVVCQMGLCSPFSCYLAFPLYQLSKNQSANSMVSGGFSDVEMPLIQNELWEV